VRKEDDAAARRVYGCRAVNDGDGLFAACLAPPFMSWACWKTGPGCVESRPRKGDGS
jgi:hypothetical protein